MRLKDVFVRNLKKCRKERRLSQMRLAGLCGTSTAYIGQIEIGARFPSMEMVEKIAAALSVKPHLLFWDETGGPPPSQEAAAPPETYAMPEAVKEALVAQLTEAVRRVVRQQ